MARIVRSMRAVGRPKPLIHALTRARDGRGRTFSVMSRTEVAAIVLGTKTGVTARKAADTFAGTLSESERRAILDAPAAARKHGWLALSNHVQRLRRDPYAVHAFEDDDSAVGRDSLELRDWFAETFRCQPEPSRPPGAAPPRETFAAWRVFQERRNSSKVYLPRAAVRTAMTAAGFPPNAADGALVAAHSGDNLVTHVEYARMQAAVRAFVRGASVLDPKLGRKLQLADLDDAQREHARGVAATAFSCLNGRAGTGKTTLVSAVVAATIEAGVSVVCLAPTHRAKNNLANRLPASVALATIDAFVKASPSDSSRKARRFIFVDEASMVCLEKMARLARAAMDAVAWQVCLVGDAGQLEPIGRGEMFRTALEKCGAGHFELSKCYRAENVDLFDAQTAIRNGTIPPDSESVTVRLFTSDSAVEKAVAEYIDATGADAQYIAWTNRTCDLVNRLVQENVHGKPCKDLKPKVGDRVVFIGRNQPRKGLTNAMVGTVVRYEGAYKLSVDFEGGAGTMECAERDVALAYCLTVHKAQGSEFPRVCVVATGVAAMARSLDRRWLYTAVSRAKRRCDLLATRDIGPFTAAPMRRREPVGVSFSASPARG